MDINYGVSVLFVMLIGSICCDASNFQPISYNHPSVALELFTPSGGSFSRTSLYVGMAFETLAGIISLASTDIDQSLIDAIKKDILKLFDGAEKYDDGAYYFDEKLVDGEEYQGPVSASSSVVLGVTAYATATSESLNLPAEKIHGLAKFLLAVETPGNGKDLYHQIVALVSFENNRFFTPLILSLPASVLSLTSKDQLKVKVSTVLGSSAPPLSVKLMQIFSSESQDSAVLNQDLKFDSKDGLYYMDALPESIDVGRYIFSFEVVLHDPENKNIFVTGGRARVAVYVTGVIEINHAELSIRDSDVGSVESLKKLDLNGKNEIALSANHLQKLKISFQLNTPLGHTFKPHQAFLMLRHESRVEHIFMVGTTGKNFEIILDFLGLVDKFYYLSGKYELQLSIGDTAMENSFSQHLGHVDLDLPEPPEKATRPPAQPTDLYSRYGPKAEITHIFRAPEKRPLRELSHGFLGLVLLPFIGFLIGLLRLGVNLKNFPTTAVFALLFHVGIGAVLLLYSLFWLKLNLFTTLKALGFLGVFLMFVGHRTLSHLASASAKLKSS